MRYHPCIIPALLAIFGMVGSANAAFIHETTVASKDRIVGARRTTDAPDLGYYEGVGGPVGTGGSKDERTHTTRIIGLTLPTLGVGQTIESAVLTFTVTEFNTQKPETSMDVYLLDTPNPSGTGTDFFYDDSVIQTSVGETQVEHLGRTTRTDVNGKSTGADSKSNLNIELTYALSADALDLLRNFYSGHAPSQAEAFLRFNLTLSTPDLNYKAFDEFNRYTIDQNSVRLTLTAVPEPATLGLLAMGSLALCLRPSRRRGVA